MNMQFELIVILVVGAVIGACFSLFRGVKKGTPEYCLRSVYGGGLLLTLWLCARLYFYHIYGEISLEPLVIPFAAFLIIGFHGARWFRLTRSNERG